VKFGGAGATVAQAPPATVGNVAYGGGSAASSGGGVQYWHIAVCTGVAATAWLCFLRWTLPG
jgi:hypothetical protein